MNLSDGDESASTVSNRSVLSASVPPCRVCGTTYHELAASEAHLAQKGSTVIQETRKQHEQVDRDLAKSGHVPQFGFRAQADARATLLYQMQKGLAARLSKMAERRSLLEREGICCHECSLKASKNPALAAKGSQKQPAASTSRPVDDTDWSSLQEFLARAKLSHHFEMLKAEQIDLDRLLNLRDEYFKELGFRIGERQALQDAIKAYKGEGPPPTAAPASLVSPSKNANWDGSHHARIRQFDTFGGTGLS